MGEDLPADYDTCSLGFQPSAQRPLFGSLLRLQVRTFSENFDFRLIREIIKE